MVTYKSLHKPVTNWYWAKKPQGGDAVCTTAWFSPVAVVVEAAAAVVTVVRNTNNILGFADNTGCRGGFDAGQGEWG